MEREALTFPVVSREAEPSAAGAPRGGMLSLAVAVPALGCASRLTAANISLGRRVGWVSFFEAAMPYTVRRMNWQEPTPGRYFRLPGWRDVATFDSREAAEYDRNAWEAEVRTTVNPFTCGNSFAELSTLPVPVLYDWLMDAGLEPPPPEVGLAGWSRWWAAAEPSMSDGQFARAWEGLNVLRFYDTVERPAGELFVVQVVDCGYDESEYTNVARYEGGRAESIHRDRAAAERRRAEHGSVPDDHYEYAFVLGARLEAGRNPFRDPKPADPRSQPLSELPATDIAAIPLASELSALRRGDPVHLVVRLSWAWSEAEPGSVWRGAGAEDGVPVAACPTRAAAEAQAWDWDEAARLYLNPFRFGHPARLTTVGEAGFKAMLRETELVIPADDWRYSFRAATRRDGGPDERPPSWFDWWASAVDGMSHDQRDTVWDLLDQLPFHAVVELRLED